MKNKLKDFEKNSESFLIWRRKYMKFDEVKNSVNEWIWDQFLGTYLWILNADEETKMIKAKGLGGLETEVLFCEDRFFKNAQKSVFCV